VIRREDEVGSSALGWVAGLALAALVLLAGLQVLR
jgi:hypothetical protein